MNPFVLQGQIVELQKSIMELVATSIKLNDHTEIETKIQFMSNQISELKEKLSQYAHQEQDYNSLEYRIS